MIRTIARKEILETWRDGRIRVAAGLLLTLLLLALAIGVQHWRAAEVARAAAQAQDASIWRAQGPMNPHSAAHFGRYVFKHPGPLGFLDEGVNPYAGSTVSLEAHVQTPARARPAEDGAFAPPFGELTAALVLQLLVPLLIILVAFAAFTGERESGSFRQVLSTGVRLRHLVIGKALGLSAGLGVLLIPVAVLGAAAVLLHGDHDAGAREDLLRLALLTTAYLLYFGAWIGVTLAVSARARSSRQALLVLLGGWLLATLLVPRLATDMAEQAAPPPSLNEFRQAIAADMKNGISGHDPQDARLEQIKQKLFKQYGVTRVEDLPINFDGVDLAEGERYGNEVMDRQYGRLWAVYERQAGAEAWFGLASPLVALRPLSMALAGTGLAEHEHFVRHAEQFRRTFIKQLTDYHIVNGKFDDWSFTAGAELWAKAPAFSYAAPPLASALVANLEHVALLLGWCAVAWLAALWAVRRTSVEA